MAICKKCFKDIFSNYAICKFCKCSYHKRCIFGNVNNDQLMCFNCTGNLFPYNHIFDDNEFRYSLHYFHNSIEYNRLLSLKLNPFAFDDFINDNTANDLVKDWLLDDSLHEIFEIRKKCVLINLIDFNPLHTFRQLFTGISPLKYVFLPFFISKHISLFLFIATKHDVICQKGSDIMHMHYYHDYC